MAKKDSPPTYEDALNSPKYENYPPQQTYWLPVHDGAPLPPVYSQGPNMYPSQASAQYPGQTDVYSQTGMRFGPGYPPPVMPTEIPTIPPGTPTSSPGDIDEYDPNTWESTTIRHAFIRKVYLILTAQLFFTLSIVAVFTFVDSVRSFVIEYPAIYWGSFGVYFVTYCILVCCKGPRRRFPWNLLLLLVFTLAMSYMTGTISSYYETKAVFLAIGITAIVCIAVTIFCFQTKVDFTSCGGLFCILGVVVLITGIVTSIVLSFKYVPWLHMLYAAIGAIVYTLFLAYNTQLLIGNREMSISPEEYIFAALSIYVDIVHIFLFILEIGGNAME